MKNKKQIPQTFSDFGSKKNTHVHFRTTKQVKEELRKQWDYKNFPETARTYPNPYDPKSQVNFSSESEYLEFCLRCLSHAGHSSWYIFSNILNPDFPNED